LEKARDYLMERKQFGRPIGDNQFLQFKLAEMAMELVSARWREACPGALHMMTLTMDDGEWVWWIGLAG
jgi:alkylation response protein AidB-like acyl-CoA dehydrogenase